MTVLRPQLYPNEGSSDVTEPEASAITQVPLSAGQRGLWLAQKLSPDVPISEAQYIELRGDLDVDLLRAVTIRAGREFQSGYLRLVEVDGEPYQFFDPSRHADVAFEQMVDERVPRRPHSGHPPFQVMLALRNLEADVELPVVDLSEAASRFDLRFVVSADHDSGDVTLAVTYATGPYHLLGYSLGGTIAHAIAVRLRADGESVATLADLIYFSATAHPEDDPRPVLAWNNLITGRITDHRIPIRHERMIEPDSLRAIGFVLTEHFRSSRTTAPEPNTPTRTSR
ncbi:thioesterase domain-containing protein [Nocardia sp. NPDC049707]|uniref:thioesterase domain-containing protein n=1 Tax=Nocardia sp. NPDC049707 TaxID=3154735 RepID=UPI003431DB3F